MLLKGQVSLTRINLVKLVRGIHIFRNTIREFGRRVVMKHTLIVLLFSIAVYIILILMSNAIFPVTDNVIINRTISGVLGVISVSVALLVTKKIIIKNPR